jgi:ATP-dependent Zn protease
MLGAVGGFKNIFAFAQMQGQCILFFDEFHLYHPQVQGQNQALQDLLTGLDEIDLNNDPERQVIVIAATNRPELLDLALRRSKRFTEIKCTLPNLEQRRHVIQIKAQRSLVIEDIDFNLFAQLTAGCSFADIVKMFEHAELLARKTGITQAHLYEALNEIIRKVKPEFSLTAEEAYRVVVHQAGSALAHMLLSLHHIHFDMVTIKSYIKRPQELHEFEMMGKDKEAKIKKVHKPKYGTIFTWRDDETLLKNDTVTQENLCKIQLAGLVAQRIFLSSESYRHKDRQRAFALAQIIVLNGLSMNDLSTKQQEEVKDQALRLIKKYEEEVHALLTHHKEALIKIIKALEEKRFLSVDEIKALMQ